MAIFDDDPAHFGIQSATLERNSFSSAESDLPCDRNASVNFTLKSACTAHVTFLTPSAFDVLFNDASGHVKIQPDMHAVFAKDLDIRKQS